ncbi:unnamed protein product [Rotaria sordida]|uniref:Uncharacterized protein n=1 Tax=Rotaria sordida TaxID=392033 RepID=A0A814LAD6_9BILA|nr:unnamed protein product [Rotaria sordida]
MTTNENQLEIETELSEEKQILLKKLSTIFDPETAIDFVCPKTRETKEIVTIEELKQVNYEQPEERLQRLRSLEHYQTTTQSLSRIDLEASYQAFVRGQVGQQQYSRNELEQFVRNSSDIDAAKRYFDSTHDIPTNSLQSHLLFHSSKLNEQRANLLKSRCSNRSLKQLNDNFSLHNFFPEKFTTHLEYPSKQKEIFDNQKNNIRRPHSMHVEHKDKKYCIKFIKDSNNLPFLPKTLHHSTNNRHLFIVEQKNIESLFDAEISTENALSTTSNTSNIHRETFPPLSLSALREYRPTLTPKSAVIPTTDTQKQKQYRKIQQKTDFIWEQSIVPSRHE